jgi:hypothetical protein
MWKKNKTFIVFIIIFIICLGSFGCTLNQEWHPDDISPNFNIEEYEQYIPQVVQQYNQLAKQYNESMNNFSYTGDINSINIKRCPDFINLQNLTNIHISNDKFTISENNNSFAVPMNFNSQLSYISDDYFSDNFNGFVFKEDDMKSFATSFFHVMDNEWELLSEYGYEIEWAEQLFNQMKYNGYIHLDKDKNIEYILIKGDIPVDLQYGAHFYFRLFADGNLELLVENASAKTITQQIDGKTKDDYDCSKLQIYLTCNIFKTADIQIQLKGNSINTLTNDNQYLECIINASKNEEN